MRVSTCMRAIVSDGVCASMTVSVGCESVRASMR